MNEKSIWSLIIFAIIGGLIGYGTGQWLSSVPVEAGTSIGAGIGGLVGFVVGQW